MEEKKLTDEQLIHALEEFERDIDMNETGIYTKILDLIRRLQEENECLNAKDRLNQIDIDELHKEREKRVEEVYADFMQDYKIMREELNACQNELAEYERKLADGELDIASYARSWEEGDNRTVTCDLLNAMEQAVALFNKQKAEIERLTEERNEYKGLYETMYRKWSDLSDKEFNCDALRKEKNEYFDKAVELQKQVDELKEDIAEKDSVIDNLIKERPSIEKYAVKDTAKEIYDDIDKSDILVVQTQEYGEIEVVPIERLQEIVKSKGVEVE